MADSKSPILFIYARRSSFVANDIAGLSNNQDIKEYSFGIRKGLSHIIAQLKLFIYILFNQRRFGSFFIWFADYHALIPALIKKLFNKRLIIAIGGFDAAKIPEFQYGAFSTPLRAIIIKFVIKKSDLLVFSSEYTRYSLEYQLNQQILSKIPQLVAYPGFKCLNHDENSQERDVFMCYVALCESKDRMIIKGVDRFLECVLQYPEKKFILIGPSGDAYLTIESTKPHNLELYSILAYQELKDLLKRSKSIGLFSRYEAFGMVVLEGMCAGCIPITLSKIGSAEILMKNPKSGILLDEFSPSEAVEKILAFEEKINLTEHRLLLRQVVFEFFSPENRSKRIEEKLLSLWA